jgi:hypothetical protein
MVYELVSRPPGGLCSAVTPFPAELLKRVLDHATDFPPVSEEPKEKSFQTGLYTVFANRWEGESPEDMLNGSC